MGFSSLVKWMYSRSWAWEDAGGLLFQVSGHRRERPELMAADRYFNMTHGGRYGQHHFVGYGYYRLKKSGSNDSSAYKTYLKLADGHSSSPRFLDIQASVSYTTYWEMK